MKKKILIAFLVFIVGISIGAGVVFMLLSQSGKTESVTLDNNTAQNAKIDQKTPENTISPQEIATNPQKYLDKQIKVYGIINKINDEQYSIASTNPKETLGLRIDFSQSNVNPNDYANPSIKAGSDETIIKNAKLKDPVTVVGAVKQSNLDNNSYTIALYVISIAK